MIYQYKEVIETIKDLSDVGKGVVIIGLIATVSILSIKDMLKPSAKAEQTT